MRSVPTDPRSPDILSELHNKLCAKIVGEIIKEFPETTEQLVILESLLYGFISYKTKSPVDRLKLLHILVEGATIRLVEEK